MTRNVSLVEGRFYSRGIALPISKRHGSKFCDFMFFFVLNIHSSLAGAAPRPRIARCLERQIQTDPRKRFLLVSSLAACLAIPLCNTLLFPDQFRSTRSSCQNHTQHEATTRMSTTNAPKRCHSVKTPLEVLQSALLQFELGIT